MPKIKFGSVCSGIEAASVAWEPLGWEASWVSEIEPFPAALLSHRFSEVENLGDMREIPNLLRAWMAEAPDILVGGTPCQAFSVAGMRGGLADERGSLTMTFVEIANEIDREKKCVIVWENVPGVLSSKDNAFGCFLGALAGEDCELQPSGKRWPNAGCVYGPERAVAWRVLDAQYFGLAQRRKRVFVVASARDGFDPAKVLFEFEGVRRDSPPSREAGKETSGNVGASTNQTGFRKLTFESYAQDETASTMMARDYKSYTDLVAYSFDALGSNSMKSANPHSGCREVDLAETLDTTNPCPSKNQGGIGIVSKAYGIPGNWIGRKPENGGNSTQFMHEIAPNQTATDKHGVNAIQGSVIGRKPENGPRGSGYDETGVCFTQTAVDRHAVAIGAFKAGQGAAAGSIGFSEYLSPTLTSAESGSNRTPALLYATAVRRLTPIECERLQGFPDGYTAIPWRNKPADECPDGHRYKALGNSMAVPAMRWIGERIDQQLREEET